MRSASLAPSICLQRASAPSTGASARVRERLVAHQPADLAHQLPELLGLGRLVAQQRQLVLDRGMARDVERREVGMGSATARHAVSTGGPRRRAAARYHRARAQTSRRRVRARHPQARRRRAARYPAQRRAARAGRGPPRATSWRAAIGATWSRSSASGEVERAIGDPEVAGHAALGGQAVRAGRAHRVRCRGRPGLSGPELAVMAASHMGEDKHVRTLQAVFRRAGVSQSLLACGSVGMPMDKVTAMRLARDGEAPGAIRHQCSGFHAASILLSRFSDWSLEDYDRPEHPSQARGPDRGRTRVRRPMSTSCDVAMDDCGLAHLRIPAGGRRACLRAARRSGRRRRTRSASAMAPALTRVRDAMIGCAGDGRRHARTRWTRC